MPPCDIAANSKNKWQTLSLQNPEDPVFSPNRSSEPKHILFYYRADCLSLERRHSELRQVTKTNKIPTRKYLQFLPAEVINPKRGLSFMNQKR